MPPAVRWNSSRPLPTAVRPAGTVILIVYVALDPQEAAAAKPVTDRIPEIIAFEQSVFGPYPFETVGAIVYHAQNVGYARESQT